MTIDVKTIILFIVVSDLIQVLVLFHQFKVNKNVAGPGWWLGWIIGQVTGHSLMLLRIIPELTHLVIMIQTPILVLGMLSLYIGVRKFFDSEINFKIIIPLYLAFLLFHEYFILFDNNFIKRSIADIAAFSSLSISTAYTLYKYKNDQVYATAIFNAILFLVHSFIFIAAAGILILGPPETDLLSPKIGNYILFFDTFIMSLLASFGLIIMLNQRLNSEVTEAKEDFEHIFNMIPDSVVISRASDELCIFCNQSFFNITGYSKTDVINKTSLDINIWTDPEDHSEVINLIRETGSCINYETRFNIIGGKILPSLFSATRIMLRGVPHVISITRDISERKEAEEKIKQQNNQLLILNSEKDKFFSIIAHDLRTPFQGFLSMTEIMANDIKTISSERLARFGSVMHQTASNLYELLKNLLEWAQMQKGTVNFEPDTILLNNLFETNIETISKRFEQKGVVIINLVTEPVDVYADSKMINSVILNLLSNAVKFTNRNGKVTINAKLIKENVVEVSVADTGIGMSENILERLFKIGEKTGRTGTEGELSTGLGLMLCKEFVEKNHGKISAESEEGKGSTFKFTVPKAKTY